MSLLRLGLNEPSPKKESPAVDGGGETESSGIDVSALSKAPTYSEFVPSMHSNMTLTSTMPEKEPVFPPDAILEQKVVAVLETVYDPEIPVDIYKLGLIYHVHAPASEDTPDQVKVIMTLTSPNCPAAQSLPVEVKNKIERLDEVNDATVEITFDPPWTPELMDEAARLVLNLD